MRKWFAKAMIDRFGRKYDYDVSYMRAMLDASPEAFFKFIAVTKLSLHAEAAPKDAVFAAKLVGTLIEDCGPCTQLVADMAREAGVADDVIAAILSRDESAMSADAAIGYLFADAVARRSDDEDAARERVRTAWGEKGVIDLTFALQISRLYPMTKAGLGYAKTCSRVMIGERAIAVAKAA